MPLFTVKVKWGKELFPNIEVDTEEEPMLFKAQLFALTGVHPERQRVLLKGITLKDEDWGNIKLKDGVTVLMMGSKDEELPTKPAEKPLFLEDMNPAELATALDMPVGLGNIGNICYINATVQCLKTVPELREALQECPYFPAGHSLVRLPSHEAAHSITAALKDLYERMDKGSSAAPVHLIQAFFNAFPKFAEESESGGIQQQDANEFWSELVRMLQQKLPVKENPEIASEDESQSSSSGNISKPRSFIEQYFGGTFDTELKCIEAEDEPPTKGREEFLQLSCFISQDVKYMITGLICKMQEQITKMSPTLGRDALYTKTSKISRLPAYLTVQFVRFYYKEREAINAKILKNVKFPIDFDAYMLCSSELQEKLMPMRERFKKYRDSPTSHHYSRDEQDEGAKKKMKQEPFWFPNDLGSNNSGYYTLQAVLTHRGRSSSSGHYVAWVRRDTDTWIKCDDETVSAVTRAEISKLSGGGDWHCAYVLLYGPQILEVPESDDDDSPPSN